MENTIKISWLTNDRHIVGSFFPPIMQSSLTESLHPLHTQASGGGGGGSFPFS